MENLDLRQGDCVCGKDACLMRTGSGLINRAIIDNLARAAVFRSRDPVTDRTPADTKIRLQMQWNEAIRAVTNS